MTHRLASWARKIEVRVLMGSFVRAFGVEAPSVRGMGANEALATYRTFTAACMDMALEDPSLRRHLRQRLRDEAMRLGTRARLFVPSVLAAAFVRVLYRAIGIDLVFEGQTRLCFASCAFAKRYTPEDCWFMSAFDEGFLCGVLKIDYGELRFACRLTEGATCCRAVLLQTTNGGRAV